MNGVGCYVKTTLKVERCFNLTSQLVLSNSLSLKT